MTETNEHNDYLISEEIMRYDDGSGIELETTESDDQITEPFDPTLIRVETKTLTMDLLISRMREGELNLMPDFQRKAGI